RLAHEKPEPLPTEHEAFRDAIHGVRQEHVSMAEGLDPLRVAEAMIASARTGESVTLRTRGTGDAAPAGPSAWRPDGREP
ncbi:hypothetical protein R0J91_21105, partial [Micrococcus sp. SIMBA_131]